MKLTSEDRSEMPRSKLLASVAAEAGLTFLAPDTFAVAEVAGVRVILDTMHAHAHYISYGAIVGVRLHARPNYISLDARVMVRKDGTLDCASLKGRLAAMTTRIEAIMRVLSEKRATHDAALARGNSIRARLGGYGIAVERLGDDRVSLTLDQAETLAARLEQGDRDAARVDRIIEG